MKESIFKQDSMQSFEVAYVNICLYTCELNHVHLHSLDHVQMFYSFTVFYNLRFDYKELNIRCNFD